MARTPESLILEVEYWQQVLALTSEINSLVMDGVNAVVGGAVTTIELVGLIRTETQLAAFTRMSADRQTALDALRKIGEAVASLGEIAGGRSKVLADDVAALLEEGQHD